MTQRQDCQLIHSIFLPFEDPFRATVGQLPVGETAKLLLASTSISLACFGVTLLPSGAAGGLDTKPLSFRPTVL